MIACKFVHRVVAWDQRHVSDSESFLGQEPHFQVRKRKFVMRSTMLGMWYFIIQDYSLCISIDLRFLIYFDWRSLSLKREICIESWKKTSTINQFDYPFLSWYFTNALRQGGVTWALLRLIPPTDHYQHSALQTLCASSSLWISAQNISKVETVSTSWHHQETTWVNWCKSTLMTA